MNREIGALPHERCEHSRKHIGMSNGERLEQWEYACQRCFLVMVADARAYSARLERALERVRQRCANKSRLIDPSDILTAIGDAADEAVSDDIKKLKEQIAQLEAHVAALVQGNDAELEGNELLSAWCTRVIEGVGGMNDYERYEWVVWHVPERVAAAMWVVRCLANPKCVGADEVLKAIQERREELSR